ncbi:MAG: cytochrome c family protein [Rhizobiaceae bacterium]|nr:cytochrome c family protein [Rhizobiaceae bacterium]
MDAFEFNKFAMAALGTIFLIMGLSIVTEGLFHMELPKTPGYAIEVAEGGGGHEAKVDTGPAYEPISALLASADITAGQKTAKKCLACHDFAAGGKSKVGPPLYNVVNRALGSIDGFGYSSALKAASDGKSWDYEALNGFLWKPKKYMKGTAMGFAGLKKVGDRANIVAYLRSLADTPAPLPAE